MYELFSVPLAHHFLMLLTIYFVNDPYTEYA